MKIKVDIFSGFLGAGKTTLIKKLISEGLYREKVVVIENEFGKVGIDGRLLKEANIEVKEVNAGCICCSIAGDFKKVLKEAALNYKPQRIIIEPSGVAKLSEVIAACRAIELKDIFEINMIITVADVIRFESYSANFGEFYRNQIINSKTVVLSRTQEVSTDKLLKVKEIIHKLNEKAAIVTTPWDKLYGDRIIKVAEEKRKTSLIDEVNLIKAPAGSQAVRLVKEKRNDEVFETLGWETPKKFNFNLLKEGLEKINKSRSCGNILRVKGIVQGYDDGWMQFDYVPGEIKMKKTSPDYCGRLCVIGVNLNKDNIRRLFDL